MPAEFEDLTKSRKNSQAEMQREKNRFRVLWVLIAIDIVLAGYFVFEIIRLFH